MGGVYRSVQRSIEPLSAAFDAADSSQRLEWLHDRMPVILRTEEARETWLQPGDNLGCAGLRGTHAEF